MSMNYTAQSLPLLRLQMVTNPTSRAKAIQLADEALLASLGYKQEFLRAFTPLEVFGIAFSVIGLLPSIASVLFYAIPNGGPSAMVWGWLVSSLFILAIGASLAELASGAPTSGGLYYWTHSLSSPRCRNFLSWLVGYANTIGSITAVASIDWGCAVQVMAAASIGSGNNFAATNTKIFGVYCAIVLTHGFICCLGTRLLARMQNVFIVLNILLCLAVIIALPTAAPKSLRNSVSFALGNFTNLNGWPSGYAFILSFLAPAWTICSFDSSVHISEEASNAATAVPWAMVGAISIAGVIGTAINVVLAFCMGTNLEEILNDPIGQPMATIFNNAFGQRGTLTLWTFVVLVQYMMGCSMLLASSRQTFAFSRDGALPFSSMLYRMNSYTATPVNTVVFGVVFSILFGCLAFVGPAAINAIFAMSTVGQYIAYSIPIVARYSFENGFKPGPFSLGRWGFLCATMAVSYMTFMSIVFMFPTTPSAGAPNMNYTCVLAVVICGIMLLSVVRYYFPKYGGVYWFKGPIHTVESFTEDNASNVQSIGAGDEKQDKPLK